jgi:tetratricopeptide (TPR) repeat protein
MAAPAAAPSQEELLRRAAELKEVGNELFQEGKFREAIAKYVKVFAFTGLGRAAPPELRLRSAPSQSDAKRDALVRQLVVTVNCNLAQCYLKLGEFERAAKFAGEAATLDAGNVKAVFRRGQALLGLGDLGGAERDLKFAAERMPADPSVRAALQRLQSALREHETRERRRFAGLFERLALGGEGDAGRPSGPETTTHAGTGAVEQAQARTQATAAATATAAAPGKK